MSSSPGCAPTLYGFCINALVQWATKFDFSKKDFRLLPDHVLFDFYYKMYTDKRLCLLSSELSDLDVFARMLRVKPKRYTQLLRCFQALLDHGASIADDLASSYKKKSNGVNADPGFKTIDLGLRLGTFLLEGASYKYAHDVFNSVEGLCRKQEKDEKVLRRLLDCYQRRLSVEGSYCMFKEAGKTFQLANDTVEELRDLKCPPNVSPLYACFSSLFGMRGEYEEAYKWSVKALKLLTDDLPPRVIVQILKRTSRTCVFKRRFKQAGMLIQQAVTLAEELYKVDSHPCYSDALMDYGFFLLNYDNVKQSVELYRKALDIRKDVFGLNNMHVAIGYEDLAYALYVNEYSSGKFHGAREYAETALKIMEKILPANHVALASTKRVKALILEEIAVDLRDPWSKNLQEEYLKQSEQLHKAALKLSLDAFGEDNVQTAKHYGNLGRLYQSMGLFEEAEHMHLQAIAIKEELLGKDDYEVGLSIGHLASLYNFHMKRYEDAEKLYLRSIDIIVKLYGDTYSGLQYDYRGLIKVYTELQNMLELIHFTNVLRNWKMRREAMDCEQLPSKLIPVDSIVDKFFKLC